jgi:hypothetical protein
MAWARQLGAIRPHSKLILDARLVRVEDGQPDLPRTKNDRPLKSA